MIFRGKMINEYYMKKVFELARKGEGFTAPNPLVGAILVKDEKILGEGFHVEYGKAHAEVNAIADAKRNGFDISGATLYVNLEPCSHTDKQTPPCAPLIIAEKISKVVISTLDPNPKVSGQGVKKLLDAGVIVETGVLENEGLILNEIFFKFISTGMPFVHVKIAQSLDGKIATETGQSKYITSEKSRAKVHEMRNRYDAILIGSNTLELDNPLLTVRHPEILNPSQPYRVAICKLEKIDFKWHIISDDFKYKTIIVTTSKDYIKNRKRVKMLMELGVGVIEIRENQSGEISIHELLLELGHKNISSVLVEGGTTIFTQFLKQKLFDKISIFIAPMIFGLGQNSIGELKITNVEDAIKFENPIMEFVGKDIHFMGHRTQDK